jgi:hypothetical protein
VQLKFKRLLAALAMLLVSAGVLVATEAPASANGACPSGYFCIYENIGYTGSETDYVSGFYGQCVNLAGFWIDRVSSLRNNVGYDVTVYMNGGCGGNNIWMYSGFTIGDMRAWGANDQVDSIRFGP